MAKNRPRRAVISLLFWLVRYIVLAFPARIGLILGHTLGNLSFYIFKKEREKALGNLDIAFKDSIPAIEKRKIVKKVFENLGKNLAEVIAIAKFNRGNIGKYVSVRGAGRLERLIHERKAAIMLSAHFGNWELLAHYLSIMGVPVNVIARRVRMDGLEAFLARARKKNRVNVIYRDAPAREIVDILKNNEVVGIMPDQDMDSVSGVFVDFFGKSAWTPSGPAVLNLLTGAQIIPCFMARMASGHEVMIGEPIELAKTGDKRKDILENTQRCAKVIEDCIRKYPEQWVWFHDRWKTRESLS